MNIWLNVFYTILIILPLMCYGPLTVYLIDGVLRYKVIRKPLTYISTASVGIVLGIVKSWVKYTEDTAVVLDVFEMICLLGIISLIQNDGCILSIFYPGLDDAEYDSD